MKVRNKMTREVYMDNAATTRPYDEVIRTVADAMTEYYGNPSSLHRLGKKAEDITEQARKTVALSIGAKADEIYFTSGGTESDNIGIIGSVMANRRRGNKIITTSIEHPAVSECFKYLESEGFNVVHIPVDSDGVTDLDKLFEELDGNTILFSGMLVNNEVGSVLPVDEIKKLIDEKAPGCVFMADGVQAYGKIDIDVKRQGIDILSISSHKIHGPNGVGALYVSKDTKIRPTVFGGGQELGIRSGTENVAGILGFETAIKKTFENYDSDKEKLRSLKANLTRGLLEIDGAVINSPDNGVENILNVSFVGVKSEVLLHVLESKGIYVSSGSACSSHKKTASHVLTSMGLDAKRSDSAIRFSLSALNDDEEIEYTVSVLKKEVPILKKIMR